MLIGAWPRQALTEHERDKRDLGILALYERGVKIAEIARQFDCGHSTVGKLARNCGMPRRIGTSKSQAALILPLVEKGYRIAIITKLVKLSETRVRGIIQQAREGAL